MSAPVVADFATDTLSAALGRILAAVLAAAADLPGVVDLPDRQITSTAGVTWDCPMVYVSALSVQLGIPEPVSFDQRLVGSTTYPPGLAVFTVTAEAGVVRQASEVPQVRGPASKAPTVESYAADLAVVSSDTAVLMNALSQLEAANLQPVQLAPAAQMLAAQGGFHGVAATFTIEIFPGPA